MSLVGAFLDSDQRESHSVTPTLPAAGRQKAETLGGAPVGCMAVGWYSSSTSRGLLLLLGMLQLHMLECKESCVLLCDCTSAVAAASVRYPADARAVR